MHVALFAVSSYCSTLQRTGKPFNPLLNETFEYSECSSRDGRGVRFLAEQVGHHPPVSAIYAESLHCVRDTEPAEPAFRLWGDWSTDIKVKPASMTVQAEPRGRNVVQLPEHGEVYTWSKVNTRVNNLVFGTMELEHVAAPGKTSLVILEGREGNPL